jgi:Ca2+-binding RTX toxin-like protein
VLYLNGTVLLVGNQRTVVPAKNVEVFGQDGRDIVYLIGGNVDTVMVDTGAGDDNVYVWGAKKATIDVGTGNDNVLSWATKTYAQLGAGNDYYYGVGTNLVTGGTGRDRIYASGRSLVVGGSADFSQTARDAVFAELAQPTPSAAALTTLVNGAGAIDDNEQDFLGINGNMTVFGRFGNRDRTPGGLFMTV